MTSNVNKSNKHIRSEEGYRRLFEAAQDGILILNAKTGKIIDANPFVCKLTEYTNEELLNKYIWELGFIKDILDNKEQFLKLQKEGYARYEYLPIETKNGNISQVEFISNSYFVGDTQVIQCNIRDITSRVKLEKLNRELSMMYKIILLCNEVLLHETEINSLVGQMCKVLASSGGFRSCWIGYAPHSSKNLIKPIAAEGLDNTYFDIINADKKTHRGFVSNAVYSNKMMICQDLKSEKLDTPEREYAIKQGYSCVAVIPIKSKKTSPIF